MVPILRYVDVPLFDVAAGPEPGESPRLAAPRPRQVDVAIREAWGWTLNVGDVFAAYLRAYRRRCGGGTLIDTSAAAFDGPSGRDAQRCDIAVVAALSGAFASIDVIGPRRGRSHRISRDLTRRHAQRVHLHRGEHAKTLQRLLYGGSVDTSRPCFGVLSGGVARIVADVETLCSGWRASGGVGPLELWVVLAVKRSSPEQRAHVGGALRDLGFEYVAEQPVRDPATGANSWHTFHASNDRRAATSMRWAKRAATAPATTPVPLPGC